MKCPPMGLAGVFLFCPVVQLARTSSRGLLTRGKRHCRKETRVIFVTAKEYRRIRKE